MRPDLSDKAPCSNFAPTKKEHPQTVLERYKEISDLLLDLATTLALSLIHI